MCQVPHRAREELRLPLPSYPRVDQCDGTASPSGQRLGINPRTPSVSGAVRVQCGVGQRLASRLGVNQRCISEICRYGAASRARSVGSPDAITAASNSRAVATTKASTAFAEDIRARVSRPPARCAISRVRSATRIASRFSRVLTAASSRELRQTSARTGAGTRRSAPRSCATRAIARARSVSEPCVPGVARALSASESRISASAKLVSRA